MQDATQSWDERHAAQIQMLGALDLDTVRTAFGHAPWCERPADHFYDDDIDSKCCKAAMFELPGKIEVCVSKWISFDEGCRMLEDATHLPEIDVIPLQHPPEPLTDEECAAVLAAILHAHATYQRIVNGKNGLAAA